MHVDPIETDRLETRRHRVRSRLHVDDRVRVAAAHPAPVVRRRDHPHTGRGDDDVVNSAFGRRYDRAVQHDGKQAEPTIEVVAEPPFAPTDPRPAPP